MDVEETVEAMALAERVAACDVGKAVVMVCVRVPDDRDPGRRRQEVREYPTTTAGLLRLADRLRELGVTLVSMESTSVYWKPVFYVLEAEGFECWLLNARHVKNVPGRAKTDKLDAVWLAKVTERGMCRPSLVHPEPIRRLRDLTRYRRTLIRDRTRDKQRVEKLLEDAHIKLSSVVSDIFGVSGRLIMQAMIDGQRDPRALAQLSRTRLRAKIRILEEALAGFFEDHHAFLLTAMLRRIDNATTAIDTVNDRIEVVIAPFARQVAQLDEVTGIGAVGAQELIAEIGVNMDVFPTSAHLVSWAKYAPQARQSAGRARSAHTGRGSPWLAGTLGEIAIGAARTQTFLGERYRRLSRRRGPTRANVAVGNSVLTIVWHLLSDLDAHYHDLGPNHPTTKTNPERRAEQLIRELERATGQHVILQPRTSLAAA